jgi:hypothetical protein
VCELWQSTTHHFGQARGAVEREAGKQMHLGGAKHAVREQLRCFPRGAVVLRAPTTLSPMELRASMEGVQYMTQR